VKWLKENTPTAKVVETSPERALRGGEMRIDDIRTKIARLPTEDRCHSECPTWAVFETNRGLEIQACDACWNNVWDRLSDDEAALLSEARTELAKQRDEYEVPESMLTAIVEVSP
jgi:hypothetical protein